MPTTTSLATILQLAWRQLIQHWEYSRLARLQDLDSRALADMGVHPSEIGSIDAEWRGLSARSRRRIALGGQHA